MRHDRYRRPELQAAYEQGYAQMYDHDSFAFRERMEIAVEHVAARTHAEAMTAVYEGAADALSALARRSREAENVERLLKGIGER